ncbi:helix-turn-helix domain-containing protein [Mycolicibacterium porcinum]|uniref:Helix-turn-helix domain-containing protein n=1 Tax=Mycolicibacterium porcinum TaxID=39693 RepID=A0ABV3VLC6_9MYCO
METGSEFVGSSESCKILDIHPVTLTRWVGSGVLTPAHKLPGKNGAYLFRRADIEALAAERAGEASA